MSSRPGDVSLKGTPPKFRVSDIFAHFLGSHKHAVGKMDRQCYVTFLFDEVPEWWR